MPRSNRNRSLRAGKKYAFVVDGACEQWYLQMMLVRHEKIGVEIKPEIPQKKNVSDQFDKVKELTENYQKVFWIIDLDVIVREGKINELKSSLAQISKMPELKAKVISIVNIPCLEYWYLLHLKETNKYFDSCKKVESEIKKIAKTIPALSDYEKSQRYYTKQNNDIYLKLKPYLSVAIANAAKLPVFNPDSCQVGLSEMDELFNYIDELTHLKK